MQPTNTPDFDNTATTPDFDSTGIQEEDGVEVEQQEDGDIPGTGEDSDELELQVNDDANLDVDVPEETDEVEIVPDDGKPGEAKAAKATSTPRTKAPEGFVKPVEFAKLLSAHVGKVVPPQVVYSYLKNNGPESKNPFPVHAIDGYDWYVKPEEGLAWWDAKNERVAAGKAQRAEKAAKAAAKAETPAESETTAVVEAE
jgi:hypothetical protein